MAWGGRQGGVGLVGVCVSARVRCVVVCAAPIAHFMSVQARALYAWWQMSRPAAPCGCPAGGRTCSRCPAGDQNQAYLVGGGPDGGARRQLAQLLEEGRGSKLSSVCGSRARTKYAHLPSTRTAKAKCMQVPCFNPHRIRCVGGLHQLQVARRTQLLERRDGIHRCRVGAACVVPGASVS